MGYTPPPQNNLDHLVNLSDAVRLGYGAYQTLRGKIASGELPAVKIGGRVKVRRADLDALAVPVGPAAGDDAAAKIERIVAGAPPLSEEQVSRIVGLLQPSARGTR